VTKLTTLKPLYNRWVYSYNYTIGNIAPFVYDMI